MFVLSDFGSWSMSFSTPLGQRRVLLLERTRLLRVFSAGRYFLHSLMQTHLPAELPKRPIVRWTASVPHMVLGGLAFRTLPPLPGVAQKRSPQGSVLVFVSFLYCPHHLLPPAHVLRGKCVYCGIFFLILFIHFILIWLYSSSNAYKYIRLIYTK